MNSASWLEGFRGGERWRALSTHAPSIVTTALAIILAVQAALIVTGLAGAGAPPTALGGPAHHAPTFDVTALLDTHLFGIAPAGSAGIDSNAPRTDLPLVLTGVIAAHDPHDGMAILGTSAEAARVYAVGDTVPGGARLSDVLPQEVLLDRDGRQESLALPRQQSLAVPAPATEDGPAMVQHIRELVARRPNLVSELLRPEPVFSGGRQLGFRVYPGSTPMAFTALGFKPGDLVTAIDGTPLNDPAQDRQILSTLGSLSEANVTVLRNGHPQNITLNLAQVEQMVQQLATSPTSPGASSPLAAP